MRLLMVVIGLTAVVMAAHLDYSASPATGPIWFGQSAVGSITPPHWVPKRPGHYSLTDWQYVIDSTWGPGLPVDTQLVVFDTFWNLMDDSFACFHNLNVNWDSLGALYRTEIQDTVSRGRFSAILSHLALSLREGRTTLADPFVNYQTQPLPGVPLWYVGAWKNVDHFGAALTPLPDSSLLVYGVVDSHPLGLKRGDVVLGYDHRETGTLL
jgi:hypothetical protein